MKTTTPRNVTAGQVCELHFNDLIVGLYRSYRYNGPGFGYRPFDIKKGDVVLWSHKTNAAPGQIADIVEYGEDDYVVYTADRNAVYTVIRLGGLAHATAAKMGDSIVIIGSSDSAEQQLDIKVAVATELGLDYWFDDEEGAIVNKRHQASIAARQAELALAEAGKEETRAKREAFRHEILSRKTVEAWGSDGKHFFGVPVNSDDEWKCLPDGKYCILMKEGQPVEAFIVMKTNSAVKKVRQTEVSGNQPKTTKADTMPEALFMKSITVREETRNVPCFSSRDDVKRLQSAGLNSGTWVGVASSDGSEITVYAVKKGNIDTVGVLRINKAQQPAAA